MKVSCEKTLLHEAVQTVTRAVSSRSTLPILSNILIEAEGFQATLSASDLEIGIQRRLSLEVEEEGSTTVPARLLNEVINSFPEARVTLESDDRDLIKVTCEKSEYNIHGLPADEFPVLPEITGATSLTVRQGLLRDLIRQTVFATSTDETRAILTGALLVVDQRMIRLVATDTHRLALRTGELDQPAPVSVSDVIIPARAFNEVARLLADEEEAEMRLDIADNQVQFVVGETTVISRRIEGQFPNYVKVIPADYEKALTLDTALFRSSVRRCAIVAREDANKVILRAAGGTLTLTAESQVVGRAHEEIPVELEGEEVEIAFNAQYLLDVLNVLDTEQFRLELGGPLSPGAIKPIGGADYLCVLMPMQIV